MADKKRPDRRFGTTWVHVFEEDTDDGSVYRPEDSDIPLSRRPREHLELRRDGSARLFMGSADDRLVEHAGRWRDAGSPAVSGTHVGPEVDIVSQSPDRLVVKIRGAGSKG